MKITQMVSPVEPVKYKKNTEKQKSCIPFQINVPQ